MRGMYRRGDYEIPVAVKTLKQEEVPNAEVSVILMSGISEYFLFPSYRYIYNLKEEKHSTTETN